MQRRTFVAVLLIAAVHVVAATPATSQHAQHYVLDAFGGVHAGGGAPVITPGTPYFGFDVAADIEYIPVATTIATGNGILVLDKFGGVHKGGALALDPPVGATPYFGFDAARAIAYRDIPTRAGGNATAGDQTLATLAVYASLRSQTINAPDDGFLLVFASAGVFCESNTGDSTAQFSLNVDSTSGHPNLDAYVVGFPDCSVAPPGGAVPLEIVSLTHAFPVAPGAHTVHFLGRKLAGATNPVVSGQSITAIFVDQDGMGGS